MGGSNVTVQLNSLANLARRSAVSAVAALVVFAIFLSPTFAAINWDGGGGSNWWFDPANWNPQGPASPPPYFLPPSSDGIQQTDTNINNGWNVAGEGVVYDPDNDPFYDLADGPDYLYPTGDNPRYSRDHIWRFYLTTSNASVDNKLTIKSGSLSVINGGFVLLGRSGAEEGLKGTIVQTGGTFDVEDDNIDIGSAQNNIGGNGVYDYYGGTLRAGLATQTNKGIRMAAGGSGGSASSALLRIRNGGEAGHIRVWNFVAATHFDATFGTTQSVSTVEFFANNEGTRPVQVMNNMSINHTDDRFDPVTNPGGFGGTRSSVLNLTLEQPPALVGDVPINMGLFSVGNTRTGIFYDDSIENDGQPLNEGAMVSAMFGSSTYNWTISYTGNIAWSNMDNSVVSSVTGADTGNDIVLIGHSSSVVAPGGDFDGDGVIDGHDFLLWQQGFATGTYDASDLAEWEFGFGTTPLASAAVAVPEPATGVIGLAMLLALASHRARRNS